MPQRRTPRAETPTTTPTGRRPLRGAAALATTALLTAGMAVALPAVATAQEQEPDDKLGDHDRELLAQYAQEDWDPPVPTDTDTVTLIVATAEGAAAEVAAELEERADAEIGTIAAEIGYLKVNVDLDAVDDVLDNDGVVAVDVDELIPIPPVREPSVTQAAQPATGPGPDTPDDNPFMPTRETGAVAFKEQHPEVDGRGVRVGVIDTGVDLDHPALQETTTGDTKVVDWVNATDPTDLIDLVNDDFFVIMSTVEGPEFTSHGRTWTAPDGGTWRFGLFELAVAGAEEDEWGVLYRPDDGTILVDLDQDTDFTNETPIESYGETGDVRHFGTDDPDTAINEARAFVATGIDAHGGMVHIGVDHHGHGTHVAGIAAGHGMFGGAMDGAAPGAEVVSMRACYSTSCSATALVDGMIDLATGYGVDVINMSIGGLPALNDGQNARTLLYDRLIEETGVQMFISAGNSGPAMNTVGDPSVAGNVVSVGASVSAETWLANYGAEVDREHGMFPFSSRGPREDGGLKPNITAPGSAISSHLTHLPGSPVAEAGYDLPPGYAMLNGTSMAAPQAAGAAALLLSAADQAGQYVPPERLRTAIASTATFHDGLTVVEQGHGQIDVGAAWDLLRRDAATDAVTVVAPVCSAQSDLLVEPGFGPGLYNRCAPEDGGHAPGESASYDLTVTRTSGAEGEQLYRLRLLGDDGTFTVPRYVRLDRDTPTTVEVTAVPEGGLHSAVLQLDNPRTRGVDHTTMLAVVAGDELDAPEPLSYRGTIGRAQAHSHHVVVPPGTAELTVTLSGVADDSIMRWRAHSPLGPTVDSAALGTCYTNWHTPEPCDPFQRTYANPLPGVWDLALDVQRLSAVADNDYELEVQIVGQP